jgi:Na+/H+ antiporter NhaD/arsenite permease-like protein
LRKLAQMAGPYPWIIIPFVLLLISMAVMPLLAPEWWLRHYAKVALGLGAVTTAYYIFILHDAPRVLHTAHEYASFIVMVGSLFVVSGGIHIGVKSGSTPLANVVFLLIGALAANVLSTTGAAMLLIRPWIRMNRYRIKASHIVFFIFIVANAGGCLTPIGDPPLFLGYLQGVPFWWVAKNCWPMWATGVGILLAVFYVVDRVNFSRAPGPAQEREITEGTWKFDGLANIFFLAVILGAVFVSRPIFIREVLMLAAAIGSYFTTKKTVHEANRFSFHPIEEVAILFAGIFATMLPALDWLNENAREVLGQNPGPGVFFWGTGGLSAVLDNAPTYLGFVSALCGLAGANHAGELLDVNARNLIAISVGSVFFGAATYIGNSPNFMIKSIAEHEKIPMPGFLGFVFKYTFPLLAPVLVITWLIYFRS